MTLRTKTLAIICATVLVLLAVLYGVSRSIVLSGFEKVERDLFAGFARIEESDTRRNVERVRDALALRVNDIAYKAADWAQWDDTYQYVVDHNAAYEKSNLVDEGLLALKLNVVVITDAAGRVVFGKAYDLEEETSGPVPASLAEHLAPGSPLLRHEGDESFHAGILALPENPMMIVSRPIVTSEGTGPSRGSLVFGRYLDDAEFQQLAGVTHLTVTRHRAGAADLPADFRSAVPSLGPKGAVLVRPLDEETIAGYGTVRDLVGRPVLLLRVESPREIHRQGRITQGAIQERGRVILLSLVGSIGVMGLTLGAVIVLLLESSVLSRLTRLSRKAVEIGASGDFSGRVHAGGQDEVTTLGDAINGMLDALAATHREIEARNADMHLLMDTVPAGLLSLDEEFRVNPEHSRSAVAILGAGELAGRRFAEVLGLTAGDGQGARNLHEFLDVLRQELVPEDVIADLNPFEELRLGEGAEARRWVRLRYFNIRRGEGKTHHVLAVVEDITEEKRLAAQVTQRERENSRLRAIAEDPDLFRDFLAETRQILGNVAALSARLDETEAGRPAVDEIFRGVHTVKGVAGSFGLGDLADAASVLESSLEPLRRDHITAADVEATRQGVARIEGAFDEVVASARRLLGDDFSLDGGISLRIPLEELKRQMAEIRTMAIEDSLKDTLVGRLKAEMLRRLRDLRAVPARRGLARSVKLVPGLMERLSKPAEFRFEGQDTPIDCEVASELNTPLTHLLRNAFDHGLETAEERIEAGKEERGRVTLEVTRQNGHVAVVLADDGKGLDPEVLRAAAVRKGLLRPGREEGLSEEECLNLIFLPGFSTAETVSDVSGRGVGMDAVLDSIRRKLKGEIRVSSTPGRGTRFTILVPAVPEVP